MHLRRLRRLALLAARFTGAALIASVTLTASSMPGFTGSGASAAVPLEISADCSGAENFIESGYGFCRLHLKSRAPFSAVVWEVFRAGSPEAAAPGTEGRIAGLSWDVPVAGRASPLEGKWTKTGADGSLSVTLFDIIGGRTAEICASLREGGRRGRSCVRAEFGPGPLSRFVRPSLTKMTWQDHLEHCASLGARPAALADLQKIAMQGRYNLEKSAWGAAIAAGWPSDERWWAERHPNAARIRHASIQDGNPHGFGGAEETALQFSACLKPAQP